jgi:hypothetical protein
MIAREHIVALARAWVGTPYHHQASLRGVLERGHFIHAQEEIGVAEIALGRWWRRRVVAAFSFPGVD